MSNQVTSETTNMYDMPQPLRELLWLMKQHHHAQGKKKEKYAQKIINWKSTYPKYIDFVVEAFDKAFEEE
jgi:uridine kinase